GRGNAGDLRRAVEIEAVGELRTRGRARRHQGVERHHAAALPAHEEQAELTRIAPELRLRLDVDLVDAPEFVEVVDVRAAEQRAERRVDIGDLHAGLEDPAAIDVGVDLRHRRAVESAGPADLRPLARRFEEAPRLLRDTL